MNSPQVDRDSHVATLIRSRQAVESDPGDVAAHFNEALALCQLGQWEQALAVWERVVRLEPDNGFAHINRGIVHLEQEQWERAEHAFVQAASCSSNHAAAYFGMGIAYAQQGRHEAAEDAWKQTLRLDPDHAEARYNLDFLAGLQTDDAEANAPAVFSDSIAYTGQVEYVVTSQITMQPVTWADNAPADMALSVENQIAAMGVGSEAFHAPLAAALPAENLLSQNLPEETPSKEALQEAALPSENRVKLPLLVGPPLDTIAHSVIAAQQDALTEQIAATSAKTQNADEPKNTQVTVEPTLELDGRELKKEHRRLRRQEGGAASTRPAPSARGKWVAGGAAALVTLLLAAWGSQGMRGQNAPTPSSGSSAPSNLSVTSASMKAGDQAILPPPVANTTAATSDTDTASPQAAPPEKAIRPVSSLTTPDDDTSISRQAGVEAALPNPKPRHAEAVADDAPAAPRPAHRTSRRRAERSAAASETRRKPREPQTARVRAAAAKARPARSHDEDTFSTRSHARQSDNSGEWTDKLP